MYKFCQLFNIYERYQDNEPKSDDNSKIVLSTIIKSIYFVEEKYIFDNLFYFFYEEFKLANFFGMSFEGFNELINNSKNKYLYITLNDYLIASLEKRYISERYIQVDKNLLSILEYMKKEVLKEEPKFSYIEKGVMDTEEVNNPSSILHYVTKSDINKEQGELLFKQLKKLSDELNEPNGKEYYFIDDKWLIEDLRIDIENCESRLKDIKDNKEQGKELFKRLQELSDVLGQNNGKEYYFVDDKWLIEDLKSDIAICERQLKDINDNKKEVLTDDTLTDDDLHNIKIALNNDDMYLNNYENDTLTVDVWSDTNKRKYYTMKYNMKSKSYSCNCLSYQYSSKKCNDFKCKHLKRLDKTLKKVLVPKMSFRKR